MPVLSETTLPVIAEALKSRVELLIDEADEFEGLTVYPFRSFNPSPPAVDIFPADPAQDYAAFGPRSRQTFWTVRAMVATADSEGQQLVLLALMAPAGPTSLLRAILDADPPLDGKADAVNVVGESPTGYRLVQPLSAEAPLLSVEWTFAVYTESSDET